MAQRFLRLVLVGAFVCPSLSARFRSEGSEEENSGAIVATPKFIGGVPVYSYEQAAVPDERGIGIMAGASPRSRLPGWVLSFPSSGNDNLVHSVCEDHEGDSECVEEGHPSEGGVPFAMVSATESQLERIMLRHPGQVEFIEPVLPVHIVGEFNNSSAEDDALDNTSAEAQAGSFLEESARSAPWGLKRIQVRARKSTKSRDMGAADGGEGVHVYVLDTGVRSTHRDLEGRVVPTLEVGSGGRLVSCRASDKYCAMDRQGHGTHCAGTIAGRKYGVAKGATIHAVKVLGDDGQGTSQGVLSAMDWVARYAQKPAVVSMSLGGPRSTAENRAVDTLVRRGVTVVVASGNENDNACRYSPGSAPSAINVGATDIKDRRSVFSNTGTCVDIFAPGTDVLSASHRNDVAGATMSGTSMACPHVSGAAALLLQSQPSLTPTQVKEALVSGATKGVIRGIHNSKAPSGAPNALLHTPTPAQPASPLPAKPTQPARTRPVFPPWWGW